MGKVLGLFASVCLPFTLLAQGEPQVCREKISGVTTFAGTNRATLRINSTAEDGTVKARVAYHDRAAGVRFKSSELLEYQVLDEESRVLKFKVVDTNGVPMEAVVVVCDFGKGRDDVAAVFLGEYHVESHLKRGNITIRRKLCPVEEPPANP